MSMERPSGELHLETSLGKASEVRGRLKPRDEDGWRGQIYIRVQVQVSRSKQNMSNCAPSCKQQPARYRFLQLQRRNHLHNLLKKRPLGSPKDKPHQCQFPVKRFSPRLGAQQEKDVETQNYSLAIFEHRAHSSPGQVGSTHHAAGDVAPVSQKGTGVAASGAGKGPLGNS